MSTRRLGGTPFGRCHSPTSGLLHCRQSLFLPQIGKLKVGIEVIQQHPLNVFDEDGAFLGHLCADLFVAGKLVVEVKACRGLVDEHIAQLLGYLRASRIEHGLLINFGGPKLQIKKYILSGDTRT